MPAEWEPHEATWIAWPHNRSDWPGRFAPIPWVYGEIVRKLSRVWTRDYGPLFVKNQAGDIALTRWRFNAWAKYDDFQCDQRVTEFLASRLKRRVWPLDMVLEGGSIDVNGQGLLLTTEECLLSPVQARNPGMPRRQIEHTLCAKAVA